MKEEYERKFIELSQRNLELLQKIREIDEIRNRYDTRIAERTGEIISQTI